MARYNTFCNYHSLSETKTKRGGGGKGRNSVSHKPKTLPTYGKEYDGGRITDKNYRCMLGKCTHRTLLISATEDFYTVKNMKHT